MLLSTALTGLSFAAVAPATSMRVTIEHLSGAWRSADQLDINAHAARVQCATAVPTALIASAESWSLRR
ncbi:hypothetical protein [Xanthomonas arboricola]|uniref:hypothetical protein n=1 Tax=Xanthomonas arboricola TaxID=56448 RepID=UPI0015E3F90C|nr:hypothetical protein [Xanthomonas arboricola]